MVSIVQYGEYGEYSAVQCSTVQYGEYSAVLYLGRREELTEDLVRIILVFNDEYWRLVDGIQAWKVAGTSQ
jgi:hypothetical protein